MLCCKKVSEPFWQYVSGLREDTKELRIGHSSLPGKLVEQGNHADLMKLKGAYHALVQIQAIGNEEVVEEDTELRQEFHSNHYPGGPRTALQDDATRASFLRPSKRLQHISKESQAYRSEMRISR